MKKEEILIAIIICSVLIVSSLMLSTRQFTGHAVEQLSVSNCSNANIANLWANVFYETAATIQIQYNQTQAGCAYFLAYKIKGTEIFAIEGSDLLINNGTEQIFLAIKENVTQTFLNATQNKTIRTLIDLIPTDRSTNSFLNRTILTVGQATSTFNTTFKAPSATWNQTVLLNAPSYYEWQLKNNVTTLTSITTATASGQVYMNLSYDEMRSRITILSLPPQVCVANWTQTSSSCFVNETRVISYQDSNNCNTTLNRPNSTLQICDYEQNGYIGTPANILTENLNLSILVNNQPLTSEATISGLKIVEIRDNGHTLITYLHDFTTPFNFKNTTIKKNPSTNEFAYIIINGIDEEKTITLEKKNNATNFVCIKNTTLTAISEISTQCDAVNEYRVPCNGTRINTYQCTPSGTNWIISGVQHSGIKEITTAQNSSTTTTQVQCSPAWNCAAWTTCANGQSTRLCTDMNACDAITAQRTETTLCECQPQWDCGAWSPLTCDQNNTGVNQTRTCTDTNNCGIPNGKPTEMNLCPVIVGAEQLQTEQRNTAVIAVSIGVVVLLIILGLGVAAWLYFKKKIQSPLNDPENQILVQATPPEQTS